MGFVLICFSWIVNLGYRVLAPTFWVANLTGGSTPEKANKTSDWKLRNSDFQLIPEHTTTILRVFCFSAATSYHLIIVFQFNTLKSYPPLIAALVLWCTSINAMPFQWFRVSLPSQTHFSGLISPYTRILHKHATTANTKKYSTFSYLFDVGSGNKVVVWSFNNWINSGCCKISHNALALLPPFHSHWIYMPLVTSLPQFVFCPVCCLSVFLFSLFFFPSHHTVSCSC